jgi:polysaccharide export outer membrane protein
MRVKWMLIVIFCFAASGQPLVSRGVNDVPAGVTSTKAGLKSRDERYRLQPSDVIDISFRFTSEFDQTVTIQPDGFINLKIAAELKLAGLTLPEATDAILKKCQGFLHDPVISVSLVEFSKPYFVVNGQVQRPGKFDLRGSTSVSDAIAVAGGFSPGARDSEVFLFRRVSPELAEVKKIDLKQILREGKIEEDVMLQPSDSIYVSKSAIGKLERFMSVTKLGLYFNPLPFTLP